MPSNPKKSFFETIDRTGLTPMMKQYFEIKEHYMDHVLFYRLGDFYEMFFDDAVTASKELEIALTGRNCGLEERAPLCGVPYHSVNGYIAKLIDKGYKVAICEQTEDPALAKGLVKREVVRIVTPGTVIDPQMLEDGRNNYVMAVHGTEDSGYGVAYADITTGEVRVFSLDHSQEKKVLDEIQKIQPSEILYADAGQGETRGEGKPNSSIEKLISALDTQYPLTRRHPMGFRADHALDALKKVYNVYTAEALGLEPSGLAMSACGALMAYILETQKVELSHFRRIDHYHPDHFMMLDKYTRKNLEITETIRGSDKKGSLLWVLDKTVTAMGARCLKKVLEQPLMSPEAINERLDAVGCLHDDLFGREETRQLLKSVYDLERLSSKLVYGNVNARDLICLKSSLAILPSLKRVLQDFDAIALKKLEVALDPLEDLKQLIEDAILDDPPLGIREGGMIKASYNAELADYRNAVANGKNWIVDIETREKEATGIKTMKVGFNKVFGYYIEVTKANAALVPDYFIRKQTLANGERYITPELKEIEEKVLGAEEKAIALEIEIFGRVRQTLLENVQRILTTAAAMAEVDVLLSFAEVSEKQGYIRPTVHSGEAVRIRNGRHPVVEKLAPGGLGTFVPNDTDLDKSEDRIYIITGPNMAGKSTYLRQVALIVLMAQVGCFVPAEAAEIGVVDRIFTRVGASDDLSQGQSTFMVEMSELANILHNASERSLIILDEIGRGTSTYDGLSIAWATVEYLALEAGIKARTMFATHYHELTELEGKFAGVKNYRISVEEVKDDIVFLRKIVRGGASRSYGIQVAKLAGVPDIVIEMAQRVLEKLEENDINNNIQSILGEVSKTRSDAEAGDQTVQPDPVSSGEASNARQSGASGLRTDAQLNFFVKDSGAQEIVDALKSLDVMNMTPIEAMNQLHELAKKARIY